MKLKIAILLLVLGIASAADYPEDFTYGRGAGKVSSWTPKRSSIYGKKKVPHRLVNDYLFFTNFTKYKKYNNSFVAYALYPMVFVWRGSSVLYQKHFNYIHEHKYKDSHRAMNPLSYLHYKENEAPYRLFIIWLVMPFVLLVYFSIISKVWGHMVNSALE